MDLYNASQGVESEDVIELTQEQYEEGKVHLQTVVDRGKAAKRLAENPDFKELIMDGFLVAEGKRIAELMTSGRLPESSMDNCKNDLRAIGFFRNFMKRHVEEAHIAEDELIALEEAFQMVLNPENS